jgi:hypothetical protein
MRRAALGRLIEKASTAMRTFGHCLHIEVVKIARFNGEERQNDEKIDGVEERIDRQRRAEGGPEPQIALDQRR